MMATYNKDKCSSPLKVQQRITYKTYRLVLGYALHLSLSKLYPLLLM